MNSKMRLWLLVAACLGLSGVLADSETGEFEAAVQLLAEGSFPEKTSAVESLAAMQHPRILPILQAMLTDRLFTREADANLVIAKETGTGYAITDAITEENYGVASETELKKIKTNNQLRSSLRGIVAGLSLKNPDPAVRLIAVKQMLAELDAEGADTFRRSLGSETDTSVREALQTGIALIEIDTDDIEQKRKAIATLGESLLPEARNRLRLFLQNDAEDLHSKTDSKTETELRQQATIALNGIEARVDTYHLIETIFFGLSLGSVLLLTAIGLAITFGVMGVINMAHGELMMIGAYTTYTIQLLLPNHTDISLFIAIPVAFIIAGLIGILIERSVIRFLYGRPLETLLATFGVSLILQQAVRSLYGPTNVSVENPSWMSGSLEFGSALSLTYNRLYIVLFSLIVFFALLAVLKKTLLGLQVRAVSQNRSMAKALGVRSEWVDALTFGLGSGIAGIAGVALSQLTNVGPNMGQGYIIDSFMVVVFGGVGNLWGTLVGALSLGVVNKFLEPWSGAVLAKILVLVFIILFIQKRPKGLFPQKGRAAEN